MDDATRANLSKVSSEINALRSSLDAARTTEYQRRKETAQAVMRFARPELSQLDVQAAAYKAHRESAKPIFLFLGSTLIGGTWHYFFRDISKVFDMTLGSWLILIAFVMFIHYQYKTYEMWQELREIQKRCNELLYRWLANGGSESQFWEFRQLAKASPSERAFTEEEWRWEIVLEANLLRSVTGKDPVDLRRL